MKTLLSIFVFLIASGSSLFAGESYIEGQTSILNEHYGIRGGRSTLKYDISVGYFKDVENTVDLHTLNVEGYYNLPYKFLTFKVGGGMGYTIPNYDNGPTTADNGRSFIFGGGAEYRFTEHVAVLGEVKAFLFNTDVHNIYFSSHEETLSNGQVVEVLDEIHCHDTANFDKVLATVQVRYYF